jgi:hypothetical protein
MGVCHFPLPYTFYSSDTHPQHNTLSHQLGHTLPSAQNSFLQVGSCSYSSLKPTLMPWKLCPLTQAQFPASSTPNSLAHTCVLPSFLCPHSHCFECTCPSLTVERTQWESSNVFYKPLRQTWVAHRCFRCSSCSPFLHTYTYIVHFLFRGTCSELEDSQGTW